MDSIVELSVAVNLGMLTLFLNNLGQARSRVAERYSFFLGQSFQRYIPSVILLTAAAIAPITVLLVQVPNPTSVAAASMFISAAVGLASSWWLSVSGFEHKLIPSLLLGLPSAIRQTAIEEALVKASMRSDALFVGDLLKYLESNGYNQQQLLAWMTDHRELYAMDWFTREVLGSLRRRTASEWSSDHTYQLGLILRESVSGGNYRQADWAIETTTDVLCAHSPWSDSHSHLLDRIGSVLWLEKASSVVAGEVDDLWWLRLRFQGEVGRIGARLRSTGDAASFGKYLWSLSGLVASANRADLAQATSILTLMRHEASSALEVGCLQPKSIENLIGFLSPIHQEWTEQGHKSELAVLEDVVLQLGRLLRKLEVDEKRAQRFLAHFVLGRK